MGPDYARRLGIALIVVSITFFITIGVLLRDAETLADRITNGIRKCQEAGPDVCRFITR